MCTALRFQVLSGKKKNIERERERERKRGREEGRLIFIIFTYCSKHGGVKPMRKERLLAGVVFWRL
jgi:hypothetical protein